MVDFFRSSTYSVRNGEPFHFEISGTKSGTVIIETHYNNDYSVGDPLFEEGRYSINFHNIHLFPLITNSLVYVYGGSLFLFLNIEPNQEYIIPTSLFGSKQKNCIIWCYYYDDIENENSIPDNRREIPIEFNL